MDGLNPDRPLHFRQADAMLVFEVAWILLAERRYEESAKMFLRMQELNHWFVHSFLRLRDHEHFACSDVYMDACRSHPTYSYLAAGEFVAVPLVFQRSND